jgi:hypothetical protein
MGDNVPHKTLQVQEVVLRFFAFFAGVSPLHPTRGYNPLDPIRSAFFD